MSAKPPPEVWVVMDATNFVLVRGEPPAALVNVFCMTKHRYVLADAPKRKPKKRSKR